ncbi:hypothetical protein JKF63_07136 [Porcisia hertigi]|uniref:Uncharacterized protein n=1 Tax=Porcisia hertigi TaxID=2761500 RepID=A0A836LKE2_9TRYP|nr:hypothetical protein JKF63_07136 [Porcisia hertigi]
MVYCSAGGISGGYAPWAPASAARRYHEHDADAELDSDEGHCGDSSPCGAYCAGCCIGYTHFFVVLPTVQLLLLGAFVLISPQVMPTWTAPTPDHSGGGAIVANDGAQWEARYGATLYPVEVVWKACLLHAWIGVGFSMPLLCTVSVGFVHMAVLLAQYKHAAPGTLLTLVVWMSLPLFCCAFSIFIARPHPAVGEGQCHRRRLRDLAVGGGPAGDVPSYGAGAGAVLSLTTHPSLNRRNRAYEPTQASISYPCPSVRSPAAAPARDMQYGVSPYPTIPPPPPVTVYSRASCARMPSANGTRGNGLAGLTLGRYTNLVRGGGVKMGAASYSQTNYGHHGTAAALGDEPHSLFLVSLRRRSIRPPYNVGVAASAASAQSGALRLGPRAHAGREASPYEGFIGLEDPHHLSFLQQHWPARNASTLLCSPDFPPQAAHEKRFQSSHPPPIDAADSVGDSAPLTPRALPLSGDGTQPSLHPCSSTANMRAQTPLLNNSESPPQPPLQRGPVHQVVIGGDGEDRVFHDGAVHDDDGAAAVVVPSALPSQKLRQEPRTGSSTVHRQRTQGGGAAAVAQTAAAAASTVGDEGCANSGGVPSVCFSGCGGNGGDWDDGLHMPTGASLEDTFAPHLVLDAALVIVDVDALLCRLLGTTVDAILFRRLEDVLAWLDVVEREVVVKLVSALAQSLCASPAAMQGLRRSPAARRTRKESVKAKSKKGGGSKGSRKGVHGVARAEDGAVGSDCDGSRGDCGAQAEATAQPRKSTENGVGRSAAEGLPVQRITLRGHCPYYTPCNGGTGDNSGARSDHRPPFALCFDVWAERLLVPAAKGASISSRRSKFSVVGGSPQPPTPFVIIFRRPFLHGLCDALPLPIALVHPRTGEVLCWNRYAARLTGCASYDMLGTSAYDGFVYEGSPGVATTAEDQGALSSTGRHSPPPPPSPPQPLPIAESVSLVRRHQQPSGMAALSATTGSLLVPSAEVVSPVHSVLSVKLTSLPAAAPLTHLQPTTTPPLSPLQSAQLQRQRGRAGSPSFSDQVSPPSNAADFNDTANVGALPQCCRGIPLPGFFFVPSTRAAAAVAGADVPLDDPCVPSALSTANGGGGAGLGSPSRAGHGLCRTSSAQLSWASAARGCTAVSAPGHVDRLSSHPATTCQFPFSPRVEVGRDGPDSGNRGRASDGATAAADVRCPRSLLSPPPLSGGHQRGTVTYDEAGAATTTTTTTTAFEADRSQKVQAHDNNGCDDAMTPLCRSTPAMVRGLLFHATLRPLRGVLCSEEAGAIENQLGGLPRASASVIDGEHAHDSGGGGCALEGHAPHTTPGSRNVALESGESEEGQALVLERHMQAGSGADSYSDDGGEAVLTGELRGGQQQQCQHILGRAATGARLRGSGYGGDSGAENGSGTDGEDDEVRFDEGDLAKSMTATMSGGLTLAATLKQLFATKAVMCDLGLGGESIAATPVTAAPEMLLGCELVPKYSLRAALQQLGASEAPLLLTLSEPPLYATACPSAESLLQERRLACRPVGSVFWDERGYSGVNMHAINGGGCRSRPEGHFATSSRQPQFLRRYRPQVPALWGDGSTSLQFVATVREAVESYRDSIEEDSSGYTDFLSLLALCSGDDGRGAASGSAALNLSSSLMRTAEEGAPDVAVTTTVTPGATRQLRLLKAFSDQLLQATATYNRSRQSMIPSSRRLGGSGGVVGPLSDSASLPSFTFGGLPASAQPGADKSNGHYPNARNPGSAVALSPRVDVSPSESHGVAAQQSLLQLPLPSSNFIVSSETGRGAHQRQQGDPTVSASVGSSGVHTRIYRDPNRTSLSVIAEDVAGVAATAVGGDSSSAFNELSPLLQRAAARTGTNGGGSNPTPTAAASVVGGTGDTADRQESNSFQVKSLPCHAAKLSTTSAPLSTSGANCASPRHGGQGGGAGAVSTSVPATALPPSDSATVTELRSPRGLGEIHGSTAFEAVPRDAGGEGHIIATAPAATSSWNPSVAAASGSVPATAAPHPQATGVGVSPLDVATPHTALNSPLPRCDSTAVCGDGVASEEVTGAVGVSSFSPTSPRFRRGSRLLSPSLAASEMVELEASYSADARHPRLQRHQSPNRRSGRSGGHDAASAKRVPDSPRRRSSVAHVRGSPLNILQSQPGFSNSFSGSRGLIPTSNSASPPAVSGGQETRSSSPPPARPGSNSLSANPTPAAAAASTAGPVRSTPQRSGEGAVWAILVSRDESTIPSCCISASLGDEFRLGRSSKCTAVVSDSFVSSTQFSIVRTVSASTTAQDLQSPGSGRGERGTRRGKAFTVTLYDRSANGTYVNVKKLGKDKSCVLRDKALITFRLSTSQFFLGFVFMLTDERGVPLDDRMGMSGGSGLRSQLDARLSPRPLTGRRGNAAAAGGGSIKENSSSLNTVMASPNAPSASAARRNTPRTLSTPDNSSFAGGTPNGSRRAGYSGAPRSGRHTHRETIEWKIGEEMLGKGGNAEVYLGINLTNGQLIAVKRVRLPTVAHGSGAEQDPEAKAILQQYRSLQEEINVLSKATHPNIVQYYGSSQNSAYFNILLEFVPGGSLRHLLDNFGALSPGVILSYLHQALEGLAYLHRHNIVHSDFKAANILITEKGKVKLSDFGTARLLNRPHATAAAAAAAAARGIGDAQSVTSRGTSGQRNDDALSVGIGATIHIAGTLRWMDPALFHNSHTSGLADGTAAGTANNSPHKIGGPTKAGDIWSVGCTMIEMMSGEAPWFEYDFESEEQIVNLLTYTAEPPEIPQCPECPDLVTIAQACLRMDFSRRPTCEELLRIVEEATVRLQAQSVSPPASPSREASQQPPTALVPLLGAGDTGAYALSNTTALGPDMEAGAGSASASFAADPTAIFSAVPDDRRRGERVRRQSDFTPISLAMGGDGDVGSSAATSVREAASSVMP